MKRIGLSFIIPNQYDQIFMKLFDKLLNTPSTWKRGNHEEILINNGEDLFEDASDILNNKEIQRYFSKKDYYPIFASFSVYFEEEGYPAIEINSLEELLTSSCDLVISIVDSIEVLVFSKHEYILDEVEKKYNTLNYTNLKYHFDNQKINFN
ncbi:DUF2691 family protein [Peribacillus simplex]|uniref:DUF2691 family protein n=1 Tax=Peribacillus simplex TaxID=1478 RepID=UPI003D2B3B7F